MLCFFKTVIFFALLALFREMYNWLFQRPMQKIYREPRKIQKRIHETQSQENQSKSELSIHHVVDFDPLMMKQFFTNPGLLHIGENIFQNLDYQSLVTCQNVCQTWKIILENPEFWIRTFIVPKILPRNATTTTEEIQNANHEISAAAEWKYLIKKTFASPLKSNVLKVLIAQKETEKFIRSPLYMALKVKDWDLIHHCLWVFFIITKNPVSEMKSLAENDKKSKIKCLKAVLVALKFMHYTNSGTVMKYENEKEVQLMRTLINHILHNFPSNSYMVRYTFIHKLDANCAMLGPTNFIKLIKKSFTSKPKP